jgi:Mn-dependent DtxR family transcriptional regulator
MISTSKSTIKRQNIFASIIDAVKKSELPISTTDISNKINKSWHTVDRHCLKLQIDGKITGFKIGNMNLWAMKK